MNLSRAAREPRALTLAPSVFAEAGRGFAGAMR